MAVQIPPSLVLREKFEKLRFTEYVSSDSMSTPSTPSTPCTPPAEPYEIDFIEEKDSDAVLQFLQKFFFRDEPLNLHIKLLENENSRCFDLEKYCLKSVGNGVSVKAVSASGNLIGVCLNGIGARGIPEEEFYSSDPKFQKILDLLDAVETNANLFGRYQDVDKIMNVKILSVDGAWRGRRIAQELVNRTGQLAKEYGCGLVASICTSHYSARAVKRLGFECVYSLNYEDYKINGETVFKPEPPHAAVTVYTQRI